jgi:hypothetical protein
MGQCWCAATAEVALTLNWYLKQQKNSWLVFGCVTVLCYSQRQLDSASIAPAAGLAVLSPLISSALTNTLRC